MNYLPTSNILLFPFNHHNGIWIWDVFSELHIIFFFKLNEKMGKFLTFYFCLWHSVSKLWDIISVKNIFKKCNSSLNIFIYIYIYIHMIHTHTHTWYIYIYIYIYIWVTRYIGVMIQWNSLSVDDNIYAPLTRGVFHNHNIQMCEIDIGNLKTWKFTKLVQVRNFLLLLS